MVPLQLGAWRGSPATSAISAPGLGAGYAARSDAGTASAMQAGPAETPVPAPGTAGLLPHLAVPRRGAVARTRSARDVPGGAGDHPRPRRQGYGRPQRRTCVRNRLVTGSRRCSGGLRNGRYALIRRAHLPSERPRRFGREYVERGLPVPIAGSGGEGLIGDNPSPCGW